ncbi:CHAT domain-containing protein [Calothrix membranacea FACHB-236]|nr:CHAT domain-containing protein [Calothrix membranacea FACHB-236]
MDNQLVQHLEKLRLTHQRRLYALELQAASFGLSVPPHIVIEIEDIQDELASIEAQIVEANISVPKFTIQPVLSILFLSADPTDASRLRLGEELREIQEKLQLAKLRDRFELHQRFSTRPTDMIQALLDVQPQVVHFSSHGNASGALCFENDLGRIHLIEPDTLAALFEQFVNQVNCVVLNACYSEIQANVIAEHIKYVIGMNTIIGDKAAIAFSTGFYQALGAGRTIEEAYKLGCVQIRLQGISEHLTPVLIQKGSIQP